ncbi:glycoside hydrolase family 16 protein [Nocardioides jejuensis]|nr:glycoside hydrolase family 16 protein [Nocardioides jejuensis]
MSSSVRRPSSWLAVFCLGVSLACVPGMASSPAGAATGSDACGALIAKTAGGTWSCTFVDNFAGTTLDASKWAVQDSSQTSFTMNGSCFDGRGVSVSGGFLHLDVRKQSQTCTTLLGQRGTDYLGAGVSAWGKFAQTFGRFEVRMRFPAYAAPGLHGGFWMNPKDRSYGIWPGSGEIDVAEWYSRASDHVYPSLHYTGSIGLLDTKWDCTVTDPTAFHRFAVEWGPNTIDFIYDRKLCFSRSWTPLDLFPPAPFDRPFTLALVAASGSGGNAPTLQTPFPSRFDVDYVKAWS